VDQIQAQQDKSTLEQLQKKSDDTQKKLHEATSKIEKYETEIRALKASESTVSHIEIFL